MYKPELAETGRIFFTNNRINIDQKSLEDLDVGLDFLEEDLPDSIDAETIKTSVVNSYGNIELEDFKLQLFHLMLAIQNEPNHVFDDLIPVLLTSIVDNDDADLITYALRILDFEIPNFTPQLPHDIVNSSILEKICTLFDSLDLYQNHEKTQAENILAILADISYADSLSRDAVLTFFTPDYIFPLIESCEPKFKARLLSILRSSCQHLITPDFAAVMMNFFMSQLSTSIMFDDPRLHLPLCIMIETINLMTRECVEVVVSHPQICELMQKMFILDDPDVVVAAVAVLINIFDQSPDNFSCDPTNLTPLVSRENINVLSVAFELIQILVCTSQDNFLFLASAGLFRYIRPTLNSSIFAIKEASLHGLHDLLTNAALTSEVLEVLIAEKVVLSFMPLLETGDDAILTAVFDLITILLNNVTGYASRSSLMHQLFVGNLSDHLETNAEPESPLASSFDRFTAAFDLDEYDELSSLNPCNEEADDEDCGYTDSDDEAA